MTELFLKLLDMSLSANWLILAVILARLVLKKAPKFIRCILWGLVAIRLLCPFSIESALSLIPETSHSVSVEVASVTTAAEPEALVLPSSSESHFEAEVNTAPNIYQPAETANTSDEVNWQFFSILWAVGMAVLLSYALWSFFRIHRKVAASIHVGDSVYLCDYINSPFILGIGKTKIYLPSSLSPDDAAYVLAHERAHLKRRDHWWKPLGFVLLSVYWFNPLIWAAYILLCRDIELACDERVIQEMGTQAKKAYSEALLNCSVPRHMIAACPLAFGEVGVKERVKSVLSYKKPTFWIVVLAVVLCIVVAVCFLTDPKETTLADFADEKADQVLLSWCYTSATDISSDSELAYLMECLESVKCEPEPMEEEAPIYNFIGFYQGGEQTGTLYFSHNFTVMWEKDAGEKAVQYVLSDPELVENLFSTLFDSVYQEETSGEPYATAEEPVKWLHNIQKNSLYTVRVRESTGTSSYGEYYMSGFRLSELLTVLNGIPESAVTKGNVLKSFRYERSANSYFPVVDGITVSLYDSVNDMAVCLRCYEDTLDMILCESMEEALDGNVYVNVPTWSIESQALSDYFQELKEHDASAPNASPYSSLDWAAEIIEISHGNVTIALHKLNGWDYEVVEYENGAESFGIRCRPSNVNEGWIYYSFWSDGYAPAEENRYYNVGYYSGYKHTTSYPSSAYKNGGFDSSAQSYSYSRTDYPIGTYAVIRDRVEDWIMDYMDQADALDVFSYFTYGKETEDGIFYGDVTVYFDCDEWYSLRYFDWEEISAELGAKELSLFASQESGDHLFAGCRYGEENAILVFQKINAFGGYTLEDILPNSALWQTRVDDQTTLQCAKYKTGDKYFQICLLTNEDVKALSLGGEYSILDHCPTIYILDVTDATNQWVSSIHAYYDEPIPFSLAVAYNGSTVQFGTAKENNSALWNIGYFLHGTVNFYDGTTYAGRFDLTQEEKLQLVEILKCISKEEVEQGSEDKDMHTEITFYLNDGLFGTDTTDWYLHLVYEGDSVNLTLRCNQSTAQSLMNKDYNFVIRNDALNAFMEELCTSQRTESDISYNMVPLTQETIAYSYGYAAIQLPVQTGWVYEIVEYTDDNTPFGIRCRPEWAEEGWLFFSYWANSFESSEELPYIHSTTDCEIGYITPPSETVSAGSYATGWTYWRYLNMQGDYVVLNEGADDWLGMEEGYYQIACMFEEPFGNDYSTESEIKQIVRALYDEETNGPLNRCYINTTASNIITDFDFHTGVWTVQVPIKDAEDTFVTLKLDKDCNLLSQ